MLLSRVAGAVAMSLSLTLGCAIARAQQSSTPPVAELPEGAPRSGASDRVMAIVNDVPIRRSEVIDAAKAAPPELRGLPLEMVYPRILDRLVNIKLVAAQGRKANIEDDEEVRRRVAEATERIIQEIYLTRYVRERIDEEGLRDRYDRFIADEPRATELNVSHILLGNAERAEEVISKLNGGDGFEALARIYSIGPEARNGGAMGFIGPSDMPSDFFEAAKALDEGGHVSRAVRTPFGWHVVKLEDRRILPPPSFIELKPVLTRQWSREIIAELLARLRSEADIQRFDYDVTGEAPPGKEEIGGSDFGTQQRGESEIAPDPGQAAAKVEAQADTQGESAEETAFPGPIELEPLDGQSDE